MKELKYLKELPWLDIAGEEFIERFETKMDEWLQMLLPIYKVGKRNGVVYLEFGEDGPTEGKYAVAPLVDAEYFTEDGIVFAMVHGEDTHPALFINDNKVREALSWRGFFWPDAESYYEEKGNKLLIPYLDPIISIYTPYSSVIDNIRAEFRKMTGDRKVRINFHLGGEIYSMSWIT